MKNDAISESAVYVDPFSVEDLVELLEQSHNHLLEFTLDLPESILRKQYHADLSPLGWHLGHTAFIERYWIDEITLGQFEQTRPLHAFYLPEQSPKTDRSNGLPGKDELISFVMDSYANTLEKIPALMNEESDDPMIAHGYLALFLIQHNYQHREIMMQILQRICMGEQPDIANAESIVPRPPVLPTIHIPASQARIGATDKIIAYDNELPAHEVKLPAFNISSEAVSNAEFLHFMQQGGYGNASLWSQDGWTWQQVAQVNAPYHWRENDYGVWFEVTPTGARNLVADDAVTGINYYEAEAFARFAGCRLPHETEWEAAAQSENFRFGKSWEWCRNSFYPYNGFKAYPYDNYSLAWFDGNHITLRGASAYTHTLLKRPSFRNFYTPEKRHIFAGLRLAKS